MITKEMILKLNPKHPNPQAAADALQQAAVQFGITDPRSVAAWLANIATECNLVPQREGMYYTDAGRARSFFSALRGYPDSAFVRNPQSMANIVYAGRLGNGNVASGDGWRFRGSGLIQTTGRGGHRETGELIGLDLEGHPELLEQYGPAALAAAAYWTRLSKADGLARAGDIRGTRRAVNGRAMLHCDLMLSHYADVLPLVQAQSTQGRVLLAIPEHPDEPREWNGKPTTYGGVSITPELVASLRQVYPVAGGPWQYQGLWVWVRQNGDMVMDKSK